MQGQTGRKHAGQCRQAGGRSGKPILRQAGRIATMGFVSTLLAACASPGSGTASGAGSGDRLSASAMAVVDNAYRDPIGSGDAETIAAWAREACGGRPPSYGISYRCAELGNTAAYVYANQGKYAQAGEYLPPLRPSETLTALRGVSLIRPSGTSSQQATTFLGGYLAFLIADGLNEKGAKALMYRAYLPSVRVGSSIVARRNLLVDMPVRPFDIANFPKDAERLGGPEAGRQAKLYLERIEAPLHRTSEGIVAEARAAGQQTVDAQQRIKMVVMYEHAIAEAKRLGLDQPYVDYLTQFREVLVANARFDTERGIK